MSNKQFVNPNGFRARAVLLGQRLDFRGMEQLEKLASSPLALEVKGGGVAVMFRYGVAVLFDVTPLEEATFLSQVAPYVQQPIPHREFENTDIAVNAAGKQGVSVAQVVLESCAIEKLQLVAEVLAKSVVLGYYESQLAQSFDKIEPFASEMEKGRRGDRHAAEILKCIGGALLSEHKMVGRAQVDEKPDILWEHPELEKLYLRLEDEFELRERYLALERKLELLSRTAGTVLDMIQTRISHRLEWYIIFLIVAEIFLSLYQMFSGKIH